MYSLFVVRFQIYFLIKHHCENQKEFSYLLKITQAFPRVLTQKGEKELNGRGRYWS